MLISKEGYILTDFNFLCLKTDIAKPYIKDVPKLTQNLN